jgi:hypothetical protein
MQTALRRRESTDWLACSPVRPALEPVGRGLGQVGNVGRRGVFDAEASETRDKIDQSLPDQLGQGKSIESAITDDVLLLLVLSLG